MMHDDGAADDYDGDADDDDDDDADDDVDVDVDDDADDDDHMVSIVALFLDLHRKITEYIIFLRAG